MRRRRWGTALGVLWALISVLPIVASARPAEAHPPPQVWNPVLERDEIGTTPVVHHPAVQEEVPPPSPVYVYESVEVSPARTELIGHQAVYTTEERCEYDVLLNQFYNCRDVEVFSHNEPIYVTHPAVYEQQSVLDRYEPNFITHAAYTTGGDPIYGWVDNGYWGPGPHDDSDPSHQGPVDPVDPVEPDCDPDPFGLFPLPENCGEQNPPVNPDERLVDLTDEELAELGYQRCAGATLVTTGELCPPDTVFATQEPAGGCPDGTEWTADFGGRCVSVEATVLRKNCDENRLNCEETPPIRSYCPADDSLVAVQTTPEFIDGSEYKFCVFDCETVPPVLQVLIEDRPDYVTNCGPIDEGDPTVCEDGSQPDSEGQCPCPAGEQRHPTTGVCGPPCSDGSQRDEQGNCPCPAGSERGSDGVCRTACLPGEVRHPSTALCVTEQAEPPGGCLAGERWDSALGLCVTDTPTCPDGTAEPPGGCPTTVPPIGTTTTTTTTTTISAVPPTLGPASVCRGAGDAVTADWTVTVSSSGWPVERFEVDWIQLNPAAYGGTVRVPAGDRSVDLSLDASKDWRVFVTVVYDDGSQMMFGATETADVTAGAASCGPVRPPVSRCGSITEAVGWTHAFDLSDPPRNPYTSSGAPRPPYDAIAGGIVEVVSRTDANGLGCVLEGRVCFDRDAVPADCVGSTAVAQVPGPLWGHPSVELGWRIEWQWCEQTAGVWLCVGPGGDPGVWHTDAGWDVFFDIFAWSIVGRVG